MPSCWWISARSRCSVSTACCPRSCASWAADWSASWAFSVNLSSFISNSKQHFHPFFSRCPCPANLGGGAGRPALAARLPGALALAGRLNRLLLALLGGLAGGLGRGLG